MTERTPHVLLLIANDIYADTRVLKYAASLSSFGLRVTLLGISSGGEETESEVAGARVVRVAVPPTLASYRQRRGLLGVLRRLRPGYATREDALAARLTHGYLSRSYTAARGRVMLRAQRAGRPPGRLAAFASRVRFALWWRYLRVRREGIRVREGLLNRRTSRRSRATPERQQRSARFFLRLPFLAPWRTVIPEILDYDALLGPYVDELAPDVVHPHDMYLLGVAAGAVARAALAGRRMRLVYDAREHVPGLAIPPGRVVAAYANLEREFIRSADRVITVSDPIADELERRHRLPRRPDLVLNAPLAPSLVTSAGPADGLSVRAAAGVPDDVPLLVYSGGMAAPRGVHTMVEALPALPGVHVVGVARGRIGYTLRLERLAEELGVLDRFHLAPFVEPDQVPAYLASATVGVIPLMHSGNHDKTVTNKVFEYMHAGLPVISSDTQAHQQLLDELRIGEVFRAGDAADLARAVTVVLGDLESYRQRLADPDMLHRFSWEAQADVLHGVYRDLLGPLPDDRGAVVRRPVTSLRETTVTADTPSHAPAAGPSSDTL